MLQNLKTPYENVRFGHHLSSLLNLIFPNI